MLTLAKDYVPINGKKAKKPQKIKKGKKVPSSYTTNSAYQAIPKEKRVYFYSMYHRKKKKFRLLLRLGNGNLLLGDKKYKQLLQNTRKEALRILLVLQKERRLSRFSEELGFCKNTLYHCLDRWSKNRKIEERSHNTAKMIVKHFRKTN